MADEVQLTDLCDYSWAGAELHRIAFVDEKYIVLSLCFLATTIATPVLTPKEHLEIVSQKKTKYNFAMTNMCSKC